ncbi:MAG: ABC transporter substrate-binding protein [Planctomycetota bacterium]|nr:ABC transporter substrate-binding protein [Planctomycetota bacterium]
MIRSCARVPFFPVLALAALLMLPLGGCGGDDITVVVTKGGGEKTKQDADADLGRERTIGLWDGSPVVGREVRGPITYAYRPAPEGSQPKQGGEVTFGILEDIDSFNPFLSSSVTASEVADQIFPRLMNEEPDYYDGVPTFTPQIAESWKIAPDNLSIRFKLRECTWSDGTPMSSDDVRFSWEAARNPEVAWTSSSIVDFIKDIEIHNEREFTVHYTKAQPYNIMDINDVQVLPKHTFGTVPFGKWRGYGDWPKLAKQACGGPFVVESHDPGERIVLARNTRYWDAPKPYIDRLIFVRFGNMDTMLNALLANQLDMMGGVIAEKAERVLSKEHLKLYTYVTRGYIYAGYNCQRWPFDDKRVRQAMTYAINRRNIVESILSGYAQVAGPPIIRSMWASNKTLKPYPYDPDKAKALLEEAGWKQNADGVFEKDGKPFEFKLTTNQGNPTRKAICEYIQADLERVGIKARIALTDFNQMSEQLKRHNFTAYVGGWSIATKIDPKPTFHSVSVNGRYNYVNFVNKEVDELIDKGRVMNILDPKIRAEAKLLWDRFQVILYDEQPYTMLYEPRGLVGLNTKFVNVRVTSLRVLGNVHEWWIQ